MKVEVFKSPILNENFYVVSNNNECLIIDPGYELRSVDNYISVNNLKVIGILITHYHFDHVGALDYYKSKYNVEVIDYKSSNKSLGSFNFEIIKTYGHSLDSVTYYFQDDKIMFTGDFLFKETIGNYDQVNEHLMFESLKKIKEYDPSIIIYPGHEDFSTLAHEFKNNEYLVNL